MNLPYFITWDKQKTKKAFAISSYESCYFLDDKGNKIIDLSSISYHCPLGGKPKPILDKMMSQMNRFSCASPKSKFDLKNNVSMRLLNLLGFGSGKLFYTVSGAEAIENALKIARIYSGKNLILARKNSYHGATLGALSVTGDWRNEEVPTIDDWTIRIPEPDEDPDLKLTEEIIKEFGQENIAAFCLETITGGNGVIIPSKNWFKGIQALCDKYNILLILDEVVCGFYRTGKEFGFKHYEIRPDIVCMAKTITAGIVPFGALWANKNISEYFNDNILPCGLTNYAYPLGLAATDGLLDIINDQEFINSLNQLIQSFHDSLKIFDSCNNVKEVRKVGLLAAIEMNKKVDFSYLIENGLHIQCVGKSLILAPPYIINEGMLKDSLQKLKDLINGI